MRPLPCIVLCTTSAALLAGCDDPVRTRVPEAGPAVAPTLAQQAGGPEAVGRIAFLIGDGVDFDIVVGNADGTALTDLSQNDDWDTGPAFSPSGRQIAFFSNRSDPAAGETDIYVMNVDGSDVRRLTWTGSAANPTWSPGGRQIAFESGHDAAYDIYVVDAAGGALVNLTSAASSDAKPVWSRDGRHIAFTSDRSVGGGYDIHLMEADGGNVRRLTTTSSINVPWSWSPDGRQLAFYRIGATSVDVHVINADGTGDTRLTNDPTAAHGLGAWAPHGQLIAFSRDPLGGAPPRPWIMNADGSDPREITIPASFLAGGRLAHPYAWSHE
jgi:Tol biopolymer transport system component